MEFELRLFLAPTQDPYYSPECSSSYDISRTGQIETDDFPSTITLLDLTGTADSSNVPLIQNTEILLIASKPVRWYVRPESALHPASKPILCY